MLQSVPDFSSLIITSLFLLVLGISAYIIKKKSGSLKKIIKSSNQLEVVNQLSLRNGYLAYVLKVGNQNFFFIGHKSGRGSLSQINDITNFEQKLDKEKTNLSLNRTSSVEKNSIDKIENKKPLQHVNISDLLTAHKKGKSEA